mmetsp:Transcript_66814/g.193029  ORF Transcript_66814/g.193029 Transcript_66814/m.193029 type:complete len:479 (+) Transcript_66814:71-1507(+)
MASAFVDLLGEHLLSADGQVQTADALAGKIVVGLYFSAHWCPPCQALTPMLAEWYKKDLKQKGLQIVFVSSDETEDKFAEYFQEMPWLALPYAAREARNEMTKKFRIKGLPTLVLLDEAGKIITKEGREALGSDPTGAEFPWRPKPPRELLANAKLIGKDGRELGIRDALRGGSTIALYFSAHWCPPCREFTPKFSQWYTSDLKAKGLEVIFVSWDKEESGFKDYFAEMPWLALDYSDRTLSTKLSATFSVRGIPCVVTLDSDLSLVNKDARPLIINDPTGLGMPWPTKPVLDLALGPGDIQEVKTVVVFCETQDAAGQKACEEAMVPVANKYLAEEKVANGEAVEFGFMICKSTGGVCGKIRSMAGLQALPPDPHEHKLVQEDSTYAWGCDGCGCDGSTAGERWTCSEGCDFDYCSDCNAKVGQAKEAITPTLALFDMEDSHALYLAEPGTPITTANIEKFLADFLAGKLDRKQLGY